LQLLTQLHGRFSATAGGKSETRRLSAGCKEFSVFGCGLVSHTQTKAVAEFLAMGWHVGHDVSLRCWLEGALMRPISFFVKRESGQYDKNN
jgi:hypothetical protein